jgi:hypothetical protein
MAESKRLWDYVKSIGRTKDLSVLDDMDFKQQYKAFRVNRAFSQHLDTLFAANLMNERAHLDPETQFHFLLNIVRGRYREPNWLKTSTSDDVRAVAEYYGISKRKARDLVSVHSSDQLAIIHRRLDKGGTGKKVRSHEPT